MLRKAGLRLNTTASASSTTAAAAAAAGSLTKKPLERLKSEFMKMLKIQLALVPICAIFVFVVFPPPSKDEERKMRELYEKTAGWKT